MADVSDERNNVGRSEVTSKAACSIEMIVIDHATAPANGTHEPSIPGTTTLDIRTKEQKSIERIHCAALCLGNFVGGWNDGSTGPLLPRIQDSYHVGFTIVSLIFIFACVGYISGALINVHVTDRLGFGKIIAFGAALQVIAFALESSRAPFPVFVMAFAFHGCGSGLQSAQANAFIASLKYSSEAKMGLLHAAYGAGALTAPLVATQFAQLPRWSFHYLVSFGIALCNVVLLSSLFKFKTRDECFKMFGQQTTESTEDERSSLKPILRAKAVHFLAFFVLAYVGVEVTIGGWIVTFMLDVRGGGPSSGYVSSGFFSGLMLGRVALLWVTSKLGERLAIYIYTVLCMGLEIIVWFAPSLIGGAVAVSFVGLFLGPMFPIAMIYAGRILPKWLLTGSIGWIAGFGSAGSAAIPFLTGTISSSHGIKSLQPLLIAMMGCMLVLWYIVPSSSKRSD